MSRRNSGTYRPGDFWRIDDRTGFAVRASRTVKEWNGQIVAREDFETRHPQDFVRGRADKQAVPDPRPEPPDQFLQRDGETFFLIDAAAPQNILVQDENGENCIMVYQIDTRTGADL